MNLVHAGGDPTYETDRTEDRVSLFTDMPDDLLVLHCQEGHPAALEALLGRWQERLWRCALRLTSDQQAAWDILQETCLVIARDIRRLDTERAFAAWAYRIVGHKAQDWWRQESRRRRRESEFAERWLLDQQMAPNLPGKAERLRSCLARLSEDERALLALRFDEGFSIEEIAGMLDVPEGTVKSRLHYAKQRLRTLIEEYHE